MSIWQPASGYTLRLSDGDSIDEHFHASSYSDFATAYQAAEILLRQRLWDRRCGGRKFTLAEMEAIDARKRKNDPSGRHLPFAAEYRAAMARRFFLHVDHRGMWFNHPDDTGRLHPLEKALPDLWAAARDVWSHAEELHQMCGSISDHVAQAWDEQQQTGSDSYIVKSTLSHDKN